MRHSSAVKDSVRPRRPSGDSSQARQPPMRGHVGRRRPAACGSHRKPCTRRPSASSTLPMPERRRGSARGTSRRWRSGSSTTPRPRSRSPASRHAQQAGLGRHGAGQARTAGSAGAVVRGFAPGARRARRSWPLSGRPDRCAPTTAMRQCRFARPGRTCQPAGASGNAWPVAPSGRPARRAASCPPKSRERGVKPAPRPMKVTPKGMRVGRRARPVRASALQPSRLTKLVNRAQARVGADGVGVDVGEASDDLGAVGTISTSTAGPGARRRGARQRAQCVLAAERIGGGKARRALRSPARTTGSNAAGVACEQGPAPRRDARPPRGPPYSSSATWHAAARSPSRRSRSSWPISRSCCQRAASRAPAIGRVEPAARAGTPTRRRCAPGHACLGSKCAVVVGRVVALDQCDSTLGRVVHRQREHRHAVEAAAGRHHARGADAARAWASAPTTLHKPGRHAARAGGVGAQRERHLDRATPRRPSPSWSRR